MKNPLGIQIENIQRTIDGSFYMHVSENSVNIWIPTKPVFLIKQTIF